jgi:uncharacterized membrane protein
MSDPTNPNGDWQQVPSTPVDPAASGVPPTSGAGYPPPGQAYAPPPQGGYPPPNYPPQGPPGYVPQAVGLTSNTAAAIAYLTFIPAVIFLILDPYKRDPFVRFHAIQCLALTVVSIAVGIVLAIIAVPLVMAGMWTVAHLLSRLVNLAFFVVWLICIIQASQGKWFKLPVIGDFSLNQARKS